MAMNRREILSFSPIAAEPDGPQEFNMSDQKTALAVLNEERLRLGMSLGEMEDRSGISINSVYAWRSCARSPTLVNIVAVAETFGFEVIMRRRDNGS
jgi:hypothetical protein